MTLAKRVIRLENAAIPKSDDWKLVRISRFGTGPDIFIGALCDKHWISFREPWPTNERDAQANIEGEILKLRM